MAELYDHQVSAVKKLQELKVGALFMEPGTGKTRSAYTLVKSVENVNCVLWLTPFRTKENLLQEINECGGIENLRIEGIESISMSDRIFLELEEYVKSRRVFLVCDESLKIKNIDAKRTQRIIKLGQGCEYKLILNGTPLTRNILDIWAQMEFLSPKILGMNYLKYKNTFCEWVIVKKTDGMYPYKREYITGHHNVNYLYSLISPYVYECDLSLDVDRYSYRCDYVLGYELRERYAEIKEKYLRYEEMDRLSNNLFMQMTQELQHSYCCAADKFSETDMILAKHGRENCIIFCKYIVSRKECEQRYPGAMVLSYGMHSFGLNLQARNVIIFFDKSFDYSQRAQAEYRVFRLGQHRDVFYYDLTGDCKLEHLIDRNIKNKISLLQYFKSVAVSEIVKVL